MTVAEKDVHIEELAVLMRTLQTNIKAVQVKAKMLLCTGGAVLDDEDVTLLASLVAQAQGVKA